MLPNIYTDKEIAVLREGGKILNEVLHRVVDKAKVGVSLDELNALAEKIIKARGGQPAFLHYKADKFSQPYPSSLCASVNDEVVHGVAKGNAYKLKDGDIVNCDLGLRYKGLVTDKTLMTGVGKVASQNIHLIETTHLALEAGIEIIKAGQTTNDIGEAIEKKVLENGFQVVRELGGHGVGRKVHEEPFVPNFKEYRAGVVLKTGMVLALEPIVVAGDPEIFLVDDGQTYKTKDGENCAQWEDTVLVTENGYEILTR